MFITTRCLGSFKRIFIECNEALFDLRGLWSVILRLREDFGDLKKIRTAYFVYVKDKMF